MKLLHLSDLHLGKRFRGFSLAEDQAYILNEILSIVDAQTPDAVVIAGDVYDKAIPSAEAVEMFDGFLTQLAQRNNSVFIVSGNHDSAERIAFGNRLFIKNNVYLSPIFSGEVTPITLHDAWGDIQVYLLPFLKPISARQAYPDASIESFTDAVAAAVDHMHPNSQVRNILVTHQFVTGASQSGSEEAYVGGSENVDASVFSCFDYVALGHIHGAQSVGRPEIRYSGSPLKYSFSEMHQEKSVTLVTLEEKGNVQIEAIPLTPLHDVRQIQGLWDDILYEANHLTSGKEDYIRAVLTDEADIPNAMQRLQNVYPHAAELRYDNLRTRQAGTSVELVEKIRTLSPEELFAQFYTQQSGVDMTDAQKAYIKTILDTMKEED